MEEIIIIITRKAKQYIGLEYICKNNFQVKLETQS